MYQTAWITDAQAAVFVENIVARDKITCYENALVGETISGRMIGIALTEGRWNIIMRGLELSRNFRESLGIDCIIVRDPVQEYALLKGEGNLLFEGAEVSSEEGFDPRYIIGDDFRFEHNLKKIYVEEITSRREIFYTVIKNIPAEVRELLPHIEDEFDDIKGWLDFYPAMIRRHLLGVAAERWQSKLRRNWKLPGDSQNAIPRRKKL